MIRRLSLRASQEALAFLEKPYQTLLVLSGNEGLREFWVFAAYPKEFDFVPLADSEQRQRVDAVLLGDAVNGPVEHSSSARLERSVFFLFS